MVLQVHPQVESYWGHVNPIGPRACYDEGKRVAETMSYTYANQVSKLLFYCYECVIVSHCLLLQENVEVRVARIFNTFGPRMHFNDGIACVCVCVRACVCARVHTCVA